MNLSEDVLKVLILLDTLYRYYTIVIINFCRKRRREIGNWASIFQAMNRSGVMVNTIYITYKKGSTHHVLSLFSPGAHSAEQFQSVFKQENKWYIPLAGD